MRSKLQVLALSGMLAVGGLTAVAQSGSTGEGAPEQQAPMGGGMHHHGPISPDEQLAHLNKALSLTADQQTQIRPILESRRQQQMQLHQDQSGTREDKMAKMKTIDQDAHAKINGLLNDQQKTKFATMLDRQERMHEGHGGPEGHEGPGGPPPPQQ